MFLANRTRPDIMFACSYLATRCEDPTNNDMTSCYRIIKYLNTTKDQYLTIDALKTNIIDVRLDIFADSSYASHVDYKSHTGYVIQLNGNTIDYRSIKQKIITESSTEAELVSLSEAIRKVTGIIDLIRELKLSTTAVAYQDNQSTIKIVTNPVTRARSSALGVKAETLKHNLSKYKIDVVYLQTDSMIADVLTKVIGGRKFKKFSSALLHGAVRCV